MRKRWPNEFPIETSLDCPTVNGNFVLDSFYLLGRKPGECLNAQSAMPDEQQNQQFKYWAFISYSHKDDAWARWLHHGLETYNVPVKLVGKPGRDGTPVPPRAHPVFRDRDELPGSAKLTDNIESALRQSRY